MLDKIAQKFKQKGSFRVKDSCLINRFVSDPGFTRLISFPRTGSHWLRMLMELYFEKPSLVRIFYYIDARDFTCYHRHDEDLSIDNCQNIIYLYRNPVDTIYSQMSYYNEKLSAISRIQFWAERYGRHLSKWFFEENFSEKKTIVTYEELNSSLPHAFKKVCAHFDADLDEKKLYNISERVTKERLKKKAPHDKQVVNLSKDYEIKRKDFREDYAGLIYEVVCSQNNKLKSLFL